MKAIPLETAITKKIITWLRAQGCVCWKQHGSAYSQAGISDIIGLTPYGIFFAIEVKRTINDKPTAIQEKFLEDVAENQGIAFVARSVDDVKIVMEEFLPPIE